MPELMSDASRTKEKQQRAPGCSNGFPRQMEEYTGWQNFLNHTQ